jgi:AbrB family looped-hinge helix DNA binding protein
MNVSKLSAKGQVTIPKEVREKLGIEPGDWIAYELENGTVTLRRVEPFDAEFHAALTETLDEWNSKEDDEAFRDL